MMETGGDFGGRIVPCPICAYVAEQLTQAPGYFELWHANVCQSDAADPPTSRRAECRVHRDEAVQRIAAAAEHSHR